MGRELQRRCLRRVRLGFGLLLLLATAPLLGCSDDEPPTAPPSSGHWQDLGLTADFVEVDDLTSWNGLLVLGGHIHQFQGNLESSLLTWDGTAWNRLEPPGSSTVLAVYGGNLIVGGGAYKQTTGDTLPTLASWNGSQWAPMDSLLGHRSVTALDLYEDDLIAAIILSQNGDAFVSSVERWNGTTWQSIGGEFDGIVSDFTLYQGRLYASGSFLSAGGAPAKRIAAWNGAAWEAVGGGFEGDVNSTGNVLSLAADGTTLYAGGDFRTAGGVSAVNVARWNGTAWAAMGAGLVTPNVQSWVQTLAMLDGALVAGGVLGLDPVRRWTGSQWVSMFHASGSVRAFTFHNGSLIAGGYFPPSGSQTANGIARWVP